MTKAHELDRSKQTDAAARNHDDAVAPGRLMRSAALVGPNGPMPSGLIQRKARDANGVEEGAGDAVARASSSSGAALPDGLMRKFEASLGADLSGVRVHTGNESADAASAVGAKAYTLGQDIHFGAGHFDPSSATGEHLLAHEVAHTVQQRGGVARMQLKPSVSSPGDAHEVEADRAADAMVSGRAFSVAGAAGGVQRWSMDGLKKGAEDLTRKAAAGKMAQAAATAQANQATISGASDASLGDAQAASGILQTNSDNYRTAYSHVQAVMDKADKNAERKKAIKEAVADTLVGAALGLILGPAGPVVGAELKSMEKAAEETESLLQLLALKGMGTLVEKGGDAAKDAALKATKSDVHEAKPSETFKGATDDPAAKLSEAVHTMNGILGALPRLGAASTAASDVAVAATALSRDATSEAYTLDELGDKSGTVVAAAAKTTSAATMASHSKLTVHSMAAPVVDGGVHTVAEIEAKLWKQWIASLTKDESVEILKDKSVHAQLEKMGLVSKGEDAEDTVVKAQKEFLKGHGVTPASDDPAIIRSLYKREVHRAELMKRVGLKAGRVVTARDVQIDGQVYRFDNDLNAQVGDSVQCVGVTSARGDNVIIDEWSDMDFVLGCTRATSERADSASS